MSWGALLQPDLVLSGSILHLTPAMLEKHCLKGLILDVDETLVPFRSALASAELLQWAEQIKPVASLCLLSNNLSESRIRGIAQSLQIPYIFGARKPSRRKLRQAVTTLGLPVEHIAMVGDRLFTDVLAGNRLGMFTILVEPMTLPNQTARRYPIRTIEIWLSRALGASLSIGK
ncbi:hydrolase [Leptolyngbya sp. 'hensonii']|uniref:YqeG family HAD IIIA-type phosphatase n=1 Tax=Leptolyngbya sp. 'hensonii' TaxID=1922337 RepID=UPI00094F4B04|nr:YqeG family HAD IIIA-type phosphatase [Leptolyngbya sp. 'hensonii']OLP16388.1 hydrolase [Leptolyngbya sp. 'hensonii']